MERLEIMELDGIRYLESRDIARCISRKHSDVLRSIRVACWQMAGCGISADGFFREAVYEDAKGQERPCFLITKAGCTILSSRASWEKGRILTKAYLQAFDGVAAKLPDKDASIKEKVEALGDAMHMDKKTILAIIQVMEKEQAKSSRCGKR